MRSFIVVLILALVGCNGSSNTSVPDTNDASAAQLQALQNQVDTLSAQVKQLQLIGRPIGAPVAKPDQVAMYRAMGEPTLAPAVVTITGQFGTCPNMGVLVGFTVNPNNPSAGALNAQFQAFKTCMGYVYSVDTGTGNIQPAARIFWDGPNCTGNLLEWEAGGAGYDTGALQDGVVFINPKDDSTQLMVVSHQIPQPILIQSVMLEQNHLCQPDVETQLMYQVIPWSLQTTGVAAQSTGKYSLSSP